MDSSKEWGRVKRRASRKKAGIRHVALRDSDIIHCLAFNLDNADPYVSELFPVCLIGIEGDYQDA